MLELFGQEEYDFLLEFEPELYKETKERESILNQIYESLLKKEFTFHNPKLKQEGFVHPDPRSEYNYQFTYFYEYGAAGHINRNTTEELARGILEYGFRPINKDELKILF